MASNSLPALRSGPARRRVLATTAILLLTTGVVTLSGAPLAASPLARANVHWTALLLPPAAPIGSGAHGGAQGYLGIVMRNVSDPVTASLHLRETHGVAVMMVDHDSPAWQAGIREHDVVVGVNGVNVDTEDQLSHMLREFQPGRTIQVVISRDGAQQTLNAVMADREEIGKRAWEQHWVVPAPPDTFDPPVAAAPPPPGKARGSSGVFSHGFVTGHLLPGGAAYTGAMVDEIGPQLAEYFGLKDGKGLLVHSVEPNSPAAVAGLHAGDVISKVNGNGVSNRGDWTHALHDSKGHPVNVTVMREHREQTLTILPDSKRRGALDTPQSNSNGERSWLAMLLPRTRP